MTVYDKEIIVVTNRERPTHGYDIGQLLFDRLEERMYELRSRNPLTVK